MSSMLRCMYESVCRITGYGHIRHFIHAQGSKKGLQCLTMSPRPNDCHGFCPAGVVTSAFQGKQVPPELSEEEVVELLLRMLLVVTPRSLPTVTYKGTCFIPGMLTPSFHCGYGRTLCSTHASMQRCPPGRWRCRQGRRQCSWS